MLIIPLQSVPNQSFQTNINGQAFTLNIYQFTYGLFMDVLINGTLIVGGVICENLNVIIRYAYLGVVGDFCFFDTQGSSDPVYTGLGGRYQLLYLDIPDLPARFA
jgi:hypothetical protein